MSEGYQVKVRPEKAAEVDRIRTELDESNAAVVTEYRGLTVTALKTLRERLLTTDANYRVTKNTLTRRAANELGLAELEELLVGPVAIAYIRGDAVAAAKIIATFQREHPELVIKGGLLEGRVMSEDEAKGLATVDPLDVSRAKIAGMLTAPLQQLMMLLEAPTARIAYVLQELGKREGGAPEAEGAGPSVSEGVAEAAAETPAADASEPAEDAEPEQATELSTPGASVEEPVVEERSTEEVKEVETQEGAE